MRPPRRPPLQPGSFDPATIPGVGRLAVPSLQECSGARAETFRLAPAPFQLKWKAASAAAWQPPQTRWTQEDQLLAAVLARAMAASICGCADLMAV